MELTEVKVVDKKNASVVFFKVLHPECEIQRWGVQTARRELRAGLGLGGWCQGLVSPPPPRGRSEDNNTVVLSAVLHAQSLSPRPHQRDTF